MEPVNITICGTPSPQTLTDLFAIAMRDGLGFVLPPRQLAPAATVAIEPVTERRKLPTQRAIAPRKGEPASQPAAEPVLRAKHVMPTPAAATLPGRAMSVVKQAARDRRDAIVRQLRRAGEAGLSFRGLLNGCSSALADAGNQDQQVDALRNSLTILQREGRVKRFAGQWIAVHED